MGKPYKPKRYERTAEMTGVFVAETPKPAAEAEAFTITVKLGDKTYTSRGATALDALSALQRPEKIVGKMHLTITNGPLKKERMFFPIQAKRFFYPAFKEYQAKQLLIGMK